MMKLVREHINEKFQDESDPIKDMGIGMIGEIKHWMETEETVPEDEIEKPDYWIAICCKYEKLEYVEFLIKNGFDFRTDDDLALRWAICHANLPIAEILLRNGANPLAPYGWDTWSHCKSQLNSNYEKINTLLIKYEGVRRKKYLK